MSDEPEVSESQSVTKGSSSSVASAATAARSGTGGLRSEESAVAITAKRISADQPSSHEIEPPSFEAVGRRRRYGVPALQYLLRTEVHTYAFSVAANAILSFFPFIVLLLTVTR